MALTQAGFSLGVRPVATLRPHEEIIPSHVEGLASDMAKEGVQKDPIIIDRDSSTVLDGMHRLAAFKSLHIENAICCSVDYPSHSVTLGRWARVYTLNLGDAAGAFLEPSGITRRTTLAEAFHALETRDVAIAALTQDAAFVPESHLDLALAFGAISSLDRLAAANAVLRTFVPEDDVDVPLQRERNVVILVRRLGKDDVVGAAKSGRLFPCKTSMHRIDPRPVAVNFPLDQLNHATTAALQKSLEGRVERLLPPDSLYEGRRYKERLLLLNQG